MPLFRPLAALICASVFYFEGRVLHLVSRHRAETSLTVLAVIRDADDMVALHLDLKGGRRNGRSPLE